MSLLESYVFNVSSKFISQASPQNQTVLITLLNTIGKRPSDSNKDAIPPINVATGTVVASPFSDLQQQWQEALSRPVAKKNGLDEATKELIHRAIAANQRQIDATLQHVQEMGSLIARAKIAAHSSPLQAQLLAHYRIVQEHYVAYLAQLQLFQERKFSLLKS
ncbi:hypothetical protein SD10_01310 [Spirosoma radiotolerans]|uniref:Uncharacterized protein n=2 Tax=Spirosoma radiotolerans TaxID=1379870 RepID=A0A0E3V5L8_9BACT|nr:hypothetical protein SD10_01310 [Spirosoma radiotolerans]